MVRENFLGVYGHVAIDTLVTVREFPEPNSCEAVIDRRTVFGGTAANLAVFASAMGVKTALASFVGDDFPIEYRKSLDEMGIDLTDLITINGGRTPAVIMASDESHNQIGFVDQGVMRDQDQRPLLEYTIESSKIVHVGTGRPAYAYRVCKRAKEEKRRVAFDPAQELHYVYSRDEFSRVLPCTDIFFCNEAELRVSLEYLDLKEPKDLLEFVDTLIITSGKRGSRILTRDEDVIEIQPCKPKEIVDTTGAGDAYRAGFYAGLSRSLSLEECGALASASASFAVESFSVQTRPPTWDDVWRRAFGERS